MADAGTFSAVTQVRNEVAADALQGMMDHLDAMAKEPVSERRIERSEGATRTAYSCSRLEPQTRPGGPSGAR